MKTRQWMSCAAAAVMMFVGVSCNDDWGQVDPPAGNQVFPTLQNVTKLTFEDEEGNPALPADAILLASPAGANPEVLVDEIMKSPVVATNGGSVTIDNPMKTVKCQKAVGVTFWVKQLLDADEEGKPIDTSNAKGAIISFVNDQYNLSFAADGTLSYAVEKGSFTDTQADVTDSLYMVANKWHFVALSIAEDGYTVVIDGNDVIKKDVPTFAEHEIVAFVNNASQLRIGGESTSPILIEDLNFFRNEITEKEWKRPNKGNASGGGASAGVVLPYYFNDFEGGLNGCTIMGDGKLEYKGGSFGTVFSNALDGMRVNYLKLPEDALANLPNEAFTIAVWVNRGNETVSGHYMWSPLFTAYGGEPNPENTWPMLACQYRGVLQFNCATWTDYVDGDNTNGYNALYHDATDWLADGGWHLYTATFTPTNAKVYFDGNIVNEWNLNGDDAGGSAAGLFTNGADLKHICLGGNQAWNWGDPDPGFWFDDLALYDVELTADQIQGIIDLKNATTYVNGFEVNNTDAEIIGGGSFINSNTQQYGRVFSNAMDGMRVNYLKLPEDLMTKCSTTKEFSMRVWLNRGNESVSGHYMWSPLFMCYGGEPNPENTWPMFACQYRGVLQFNCATWTDFTDVENVNGVNGVYHDATDWLADGKWHLYTVTMDDSGARVYFDGELKNEWVLSGAEAGGSISGLWTNGADLKYNCLGGNQAWNWGDPDPGFWFDDFAVYNKVLTEEEIQSFFTLKK